MAKVIEFYVPKSFRKPLIWAPQLECGKVIEFCSQTKQNSLAQPLVVWDSRGARCTR
jgi:hypothetical protein